MIVPTDSPEHLLQLSRLLWIATAAYGVHIAEEYALNWRDWARSLSGVQVEWDFFLVTNALVIVLGAVCAEVAPAWPAIALAFPAVMLINATLFHVATFLWKRGRFSPGLITACLLFYPIGILCFKSASQAGVLTPRVWAASFGLGALLMATPLLLLKAKGMRYFQQNV